MATNAPTGDGHRNGMVRKRSQIKTKIMGEEHYTKRDPSACGTPQDPMVGKKASGVVVFGGGLALYDGNTVIGAEQVAEEIGASSRGK